MDAGDVREVSASVIVKLPPYTDVLTGYATVAPVAVRKETGVPPKLTGANWMVAFDTALPAAS
jgi:hypothetical protein